MSHYAELARRLAWIAAYAGLAVILIFALKPSTSTPSFAYMDKLLHVAAFLCCGAAIGAAARGHDLLIHGAVFACAGAAIEVAQATMGLGRSGELLDLIADWIGLALGLPLGRAAYNLVFDPAPSSSPPSAP